MKKILSLVAALCLLAAPAFATVGTAVNPIIWFTSPDTLASVLPGYCTDGNLIVDLNNPSAPVYYAVSNCFGSQTATQITPPASSQVVGLSSLLVGKFNIPTGATSQYVRGEGSLATLSTAVVPESGSLYFTNARATSAIAAAYFTGTTSQYVRGDGTLATFPSSSLSISHPSRALSSCFQPSSTNNTDFIYSVDINATLTLGGGTGTVTQYTNSGCSTGAQVIANGSVSSVALGGSSSIPLIGYGVPAGAWLKITGTASGGGTSAIDAVQTEKNY